MVASLAGVTLSPEDATVRVVGTVVEPESKCVVLALPGHLSEPAKTREVSIRRHYDGPEVKMCFARVTPATL